jgi:hypothetical protein
MALPDRRSSRIKKPWAKRAERFTWSTMSEWARQTTVHAAMGAPAHDSYAQN